MDTLKAGNVLREVSGRMEVELTETIISSDSLRIERIVSLGQSSPAGFWYDQHQHEWVIILKGAARLRFEDRMVEMRSGDFINIPAHTKHRVEWTMPAEPTI